MRLTAELVAERVRGTILEHIGNTPLLPLRRIGRGLRGELWAKLESANPAGSVKDRAALWMVVAAEEEGQLVGAPRPLRPRGVRIVAVQPDDALHGIEGWKHMATAIRPAIWDEAVADRHRVMGTEEAIAMTRRLAKEEGIFSGVSGGAAVAAACAVAREEAGRIVVLIADGGERYLSTPLWE